MAKKSIKIGGIVAGIGSIALFIWMMIFIINFSKDPMSPEHIVKVSEKMVEESIPLEVNVIAKLASIGGIVAAILIIGFIIAWKKIKNIKIQLPPY